MLRDETMNTDNYLCEEIPTYTFEHYVWAGIAGEGLDIKTNRK
jgi:hypothetical protein